MATEQVFFDTQVTGEVKPYTVDFTNFIRSGASISGTAASYAQTFSPAGSALASGSCAVGASVGSVTHVSPALSDPGFRIVRACRRRGLPVIPVPGPSALTAVLSASGLPTNGFLYVGFLPAKSAARITFFDQHRDFDYTLALYESCHRIDKAVAEIVTTLGPERVLCVAKEVTKLHETFFVGPAGDVQARLAKASLKGEFVLLIAPQDFVL